MPPIRFVLFDGEEAPSGFADFYNEGPAREAARTRPTHAKEIREVIVLDFIALHDEELRRDPSSDAGPLVASAGGRRPGGHARRSSRAGRKT